MEKQNMKMKNVFLVLVVALLVLSMAGSVSAKVVTNATDSVDNTSTATVTLNLADSYSITLPDSFIFGKETATSTYYSAKGEVITSLITFDYYKRLNITVSSAEYYYDNYLWNITCDESSMKYNASYYMSKAVDSGTHIEDSWISGGVISNPASYNLVKSGDSVLVTNESVSQFIHLKLPVTPTHSGTYTGQLTFTVSLENNPEMGTP